MRTHHPLARPLLRTMLAVLLVVAAVVGVRGARPAAAASPAAAAAPVRIMPLGDSITGSPGCWRALLWNQLQNAGYKNIDFVGTLGPQGCSVPYDGDNEGHGGILATNIASQNQLPGWLSATKPDIVIMHLGTNDVWSNIAPSQILASFTTMVGQMRASNPSMKVLVAQILPMNPSNCAECAQRVITFNQQIPAWAQSISTAQSPVTVVDQWTGFNDATDTSDGVHPNDAGIVKVAARWYPPLAALLSTGGGTTGGTSTGGTTTGGTTTGGTTTGGTTAGSTSGSTAGSTTGSTNGGSTTGSSSGTTAGSTTGSTSGTTNGGTTTGGTTTGGSGSGGTGGGGCTAVLSITSSWQGGYQGAITVKNTSGGSIRSWAVTIVPNGGAQITQAWNGTLTTGSNGSATVRSADWNGSLANGASTDFGFLASLPAGAGNPTATVSCSATA
ncbi:MULTISPECIES: GDSL-type esterase/lipase family protein [unclassified Streptomyces]|uniref:GDSL-type esterase/lipase family protein n=1 Tax=unclassified Streptomyces TaxID=2593676 RepID=UPI002E2C2FC6|nr:GDSL-type esterase/lipase family protein [Streptomyces sp. NBC_00223]